MRFLLFLLAGSLAAQQVAAPTPEPVGPARGQDVGGYNVVNSFELGYRSHSVDGSLDKYRSDVNFGNGVRLLSSSLMMHSKEGHGWLFDELVLNTQGLGNDPYQTANLRIGKNKLYQYDLLWRLNDYYNPSLSIALGQHFQNTSRRMQDHDLTLFPRSSVRFFLGYSRNQQDGPALTTIQAFDSLGDEFPLFADVRRQYNEYRLGGEVRVFGFRLQATHVWENFREDTRDTLALSGLGNNPSDNTTLTQFSRNQPYHGNTPSWRVALSRESRRWFAVNARFNYSAGQRDFILDELAAGQGAFTEAHNREVLVRGNGRRPVTSANVTLSIFPASRVTITNHTSYYQIRMEGNSLFQQLDSGTRSDGVTAFDFLGIRAITNATDLNYRPKKWFSFFTGYRFTNRRASSVQEQTTGSDTARLPYQQESNLHAGTAGVRLMPVKPLTISLDGEIGRADRPFYTTSERNYQSLGGRVQYKRGTLLLSAQSRNFYNTNSVSLAFHTARSRNNSVDASWTPVSWLSFDAGYAKIHLDTLTALAYYFNRAFVSIDQSLYVSNIHTGTAGIRLSLKKHADLYLGYTRVQDVGDGRSFQEIANPRAPSVPAFLAAAQSYPLSFDSPLARISIPIHPRLRFNIGYQRYHYSEVVLPGQNYGANTGYASLLWSF